MAIASTFPLKESTTFSTCSSSIGSTSLPLMSNFPPTISIRADESFPFGLPPIRIRPVLQPLFSTIEFVASVVDSETMETSFSSASGRLANPSVIHLQRSSLVVGVLYLHMTSLVSAVTMTRSVYVPPVSIPRILFIVLFLQALENLVHLLKRDIHVFQCVSSHQCAVRRSDVA